MIFADEEYRQRVAAARSELKARDLAALLLFAQESHYYLFGYDSTGYVFFQVVVLTADQAPVTLICRRPDVAQARDTSNIEDIRVWLNAPDANPALNLKQVLEERGLGGETIGIELDSYGLTASNYRFVDDALTDFCQLVDASDIVRNLRLVKSPAEIDFTRTAGTLADAAVESICEAAAPGVLESHLTAAGFGAILRRGGDPAPGDPLVNSGNRAIYGRSVAGPRALSENDQILVELAGTYRRYNACIERTLIVGKPNPAQIDMHAVVRATTEAVLEAFKPGEPLGRSTKCIAACWMTRATPRSALPPAGIHWAPPTVRAGWMYRR